MVTTIAAITRAVESSHTSSRPRNSSNASGSLEDEQRGVEQQLVAPVAADDHQHRHREQQPCEQRRPQREEHERECGRYLRQRERDALASELDVEHGVLEQPEQGRRRRRTPTHPRTGPHHLDRAWRAPSPPPAPATPARTARSAPPGGATPIACSRFGTCTPSVRLAGIGLGVGHVRAPVRMPANLVAGGQGLGIPAVGSRAHIQELPIHDEPIHELNPSTTNPSTNYPSTTNPSTTNPSTN